MIPPCHFAEFFDTPCDSPRMKCHILSQQIIKREHARANPRTPTAWHHATPLTGAKLSDLLADPRNWRWGCWAHHQHVDGPHGEWPEIPESAREFAIEYELSHFLPAREMRAA